MTRWIEPERPRRRTRRILTAVAVLTSALVLSTAASLAPALAAPGTDDATARVAEWARKQGLGWAVTLAEQVQYQVDPPPVGGEPPTLTVPATTTQRALAAPQRTEPLRPLTSPAANPVPGEGVWQPLLTTGGRVVAQVASVRPDADHTSFMASVVWMDADHLAFGLHQGTDVPGGQRVAPDQLTAQERASVLATFNSGFRMEDAAGGYWQDGVALAPLRAGAASMVFTKDGHLTVEAWPGGAPGSGVAAVRQNLQLLVHDGAVTDDVAHPTAATWGKTVGNAAFVWRTALGVRSDGSVVFVCGPALSVSSLADLARSAGAVEAMELDINRAWTNYITYTQPGAVPHRLQPDQVPDPARYLQSSTRDFVSVLPRG